VVFDLDGVIARYDTMAVLVTRRLRSSVRRSVLGVFPGVAWYALRGLAGARVRLSRTLGGVALHGLRVDDYAALATETGTALAQDPDWTIPAAMAAIHAHLDAGDSVMVTTGTEQILARAFLDAIGLPGVELIATTIRFEGDRPHYANHNLGAQKVHNLAGRAIDLFYTDSDLDLPVAELAQRTVLVNPDAATERRFRARVSGLTVERWD
jgi:phosphatidylglycerophosphatase C